MAFTREAVESAVRAMAGRGSSHGLGPSEEQLRALLSHPGEGPVHMLNLLKFRERALYSEDHELAGSAGGTGSEAYARYGQVAMRKVAERGGRLLWLAVCDQVLIGDLPGWDQIAILEYPNRAAFLDMLQDPEYLAAHVHREAGLERTALLASTPIVDASR